MQEESAPSGDEASDDSHVFHEQACVFDINGMHDLILHTRSPVSLESF
jgi:hypothetical protein